LYNWKHNSSLFIENEVDQTSQRGGQGYISRAIQSMLPAKDDQFREFGDSIDITDILE